MEYLKFPKKCYYLTQGFGYNSYSHQNRKAIDVSQRGGYKEIYAPFSGYIANIYLKILILFLLIIQSHPI